MILTPLFWGSFSFVVCIAAVLFRKKIRLFKAAKILVVLPFLSGLWHLGKGMVYICIDISKLNDVSPGIVYRGLQEAMMPFLTGIFYMVILVVVYAITITIDENMDKS